MQRLLFVFFLCASLSPIGCGRGGSTAVQAPGATAKNKSVTVNWQTFLEEYEVNQAAADAKYLEKEIVINAPLIKVSKEGDTYFASAYRYHNRQEGPPNLVFLWSKEHLAEVQSMKFEPIVGTDFKVRGICKGRSGTSSSPTLQIRFESCRLEK